MLLPGEQKMRDGVINCEDDWSCLNLKAKAMDAILPAVYRRDLPTPTLPYHPITSIKLSYTKCQWRR